MDDGRARSMNLSSRQFKGHIQKGPPTTHSRTPVMLCRSIRTQQSLFYTMPPGRMCKNLRLTAQYDIEALVVKCAHTRKGEPSKSGRVSRRQPSEVLDRLHSRIVCFLHLTANGRAAILRQGQRWTGPLRVLPVVPETEHLSGEL